MKRTNRTNRTITKKGIFFALLCVFAAAVTAVCVSACDNSPGPEPEHVHEYVQRVIAPTHNDRGYILHICSCGDYYRDTYTDKVSHSYTAVITEATCTEGGYTTQTCECGDSYVDSYTPVKDHDFIKYVKKPTCTEWGYTSNTCRDCGYSVLSDFMGAEHKYSSVLTRPTCTERGYTTHTCDTCGHQYIDDYTDMLGHEFSITVTAPTCIAKGYTTYHCKLCGDTRVGEYKDATGHNYATTVTRPTCTNNGYSTHTCTVCEHSYRDNFTSLSDHIYDITVVDPTCTERGYTLKTCKHCGHEVKEAFKPALGHSIVDGVCSVCGITEMVFTLSEDESYYILESVEKSLTSVIVPEVYNGLPVLEIGNSAFAHCTSLVNVILPRGIRSIGRLAFYDCLSLTALVIPDTVENIGERAFSHCAALKSVIIPDSVRTLGSLTFFYCSSLIDVTIGKGLDRIDNGMFMQCSALKEIIIPDNIKELGTGVLSICRSLEKITIGSGLTSLKTSDLRLSPLKYIEVSEENSVYKSVNNCVVTKDGKSLVLAASGAVIPEEVEVLLSYSLGNKFGRLEIPDGVVQIGSYAFASATVDELVLGKAIKSIGIRALDSYINNIYYKGSEAEWDLIDKYADWREDLRKATLYFYSEQKPSTEGNFWRYADGEISVWGEFENSSLEYGLSGDGKYYLVTGVKEGVTSVTVPEIYLGLPVTAIAEGAFADSSIEEITLQKSITEIGARAFENCKKLRYVNILAVLEKISLRAFYGCESLETVDFYAWAVIREIDDFAFYGCAALKSVPENSAERIGVSAFENCTSFKTIYISAPIRRVEDRAYFGCSSVETLIVDNWTRTLGIDAFANCQALKNISGVYTDNEHYIVPKDNCLLANGEKTLILGCAGSAIPDTVERIADGAFKGSGAVGVFIPASVTSAGENIFSDCALLTDVYFGGTEEEWNALAIETFGATVHFDCVRENV